MALGMVQQSYNALFTQSYASSKTESADTSSKTRDTDGSFAGSVEAKTSELTSAEVSKYSKVKDKDVDKSQMDPLDYYYELCKEYPDITFRLGDNQDMYKHLDGKTPYLGYNNSHNQVGEDFSGRGHVSIEIDIAVIKKMQEDQDGGYTSWVKELIERTYASRELDEKKAMNEGLPYIYYCIGISEWGQTDCCRTWSEVHAWTEEEIREHWGMNKIGEETDYKKLMLSLGLQDTFFEMLDRAIEKSRENAEERKEDMRHDEMQKKVTTAHQKAAEFYEASFTTVDKFVGMATMNA